MMTRQNDFVDCDRHKSRSAAVFEIGPTRTMPQIIIGPGTGGKPAFNRPYDCVLIIEDTLDVSTYTYTYTPKGGSVDYSLPAARTNAYFSRNDPIDKPRNFTSGTRSDIALLDSPMRRDAYSSIADIKKKGKECCPLESASAVLSQPILLRVLPILPLILELNRIE